MAREPTRADGSGPDAYDLVSDSGAFVAPLGRLDRDTSGLPLTTNDTAFAEWITNPEHEVPGTYLVKAATVLSEDQLERLRRGVEIDDGPRKSAEVRRSRDSGKHSFLELTIREGRYREVRRMIEAVGSRAPPPVRTSVGPLRLGSLGFGRYRELTPEEVRLLFPGHRRKPSKPAGPPHGRRK